jgi:hypothetical protein
MAKIKREVNFKNLVRELAHNKVDALELLREALANARDHGASRVWIRSVRGPAPTLATDLFVMNDGEGMSHDQLRAFWGVSSSVKEDPTRAIGYKGHGSKLYFSCRRLSVATRRDNSGQWTLTTLEDPLDSDSREIDSTSLPSSHRLAEELASVKLDKLSGALCANVV